ncbi:Nif3-like dinuclear metal center hexameric protein [Anaerococcus sp. AGMB00486]|uniref:GTP cyclohydrolase 1 type 2 homolog n=2 Tax=Anaerococcus TaxID=165779 RepID=A0ABX2N6Y3_9FIRM|nr:MULTISPECIES: Nif3-like dinuclear metal center hexameric protein [Anaerococcus]MDY3005995.1 Nif3-like dinuclear metal center hexameric protein [Anaerococcus porci]MSS77070.1 Nif3-like dinuclear metal center hexameric protein [Anaerococcus porci]NVF10440.1 Nif3-like dinuclear metal center hexameric protein [Anaerococcus faecalis]
MKIREVIEFLNEKFPEDLQEDWDNSGLQIGNLEKELTGILVSMDLSYETIINAKINKCNLIINHHPMFFIPLKSIDLSTKYNKNIELLIKEDISVYAMHTNLDKAEGGVNDNLAKILSLKDVKKLDDYNEYPIARFGNVEKIKARDFAQIVKEKLECKGIILYGDPDKEISKVALCGGAGSDFIEDAIKKECDLIITSDVKYHEALDNYKDIVILDPGHFASENHVIWMLRKLLLDNFDTNIVYFSFNEKFREFI